MSSSGCCRQAVGLLAPEPGAGRGRPWRPRPSTLARVGVAGVSGSVGDPSR